MNRHSTALLVGLVMIIGGLVLYIAFRDMETAVIGLRQAGLVIAVLGVIEVAVTGLSIVKARRPKKYS